MKCFLNDVPIVAISAQAKKDARTVIASLAPLSVISSKAAIAPKAIRAARATRVLRLAIAASVAKSDIGDLRLSKISVKFKTNNVDDSLCCKLFIR